MARILASVADGGPFDEAFARATGSSLALAEQVFWQRYRWWRRGLQVLASSASIWAAIILLAFWARRRRRARASAIQELWEREERPGTGTSAEEAEPPTGRDFFAA